MSDLEALRERLEKATEPSREIDCLLYGNLHRSRSAWRAVCLRDGDRPASVANSAWCVLRETIEGHATTIDPPEYTASLDAALSLVERVLPGRDITLETSEQMMDGQVHRVCDATIGAMPYSDGKATFAYGLSPALALCLALIKAKQAEEPRDGLC